MSYLEAPVETIAGFVPSWRYTHPKRLEQEIISAFNETNRKPDEFRLKFKNGRIVNHETEEPVKIDRSSYLGQKDGELFDSLSLWMDENDEGAIAVWISPLYLEGKGRPCNKITIYGIEKVTDEEKTAFNVSVLFDTPKKHCLEIASSLNPLFASVQNPEILRNKLFSISESFDIAKFLSMISQNKSTQPTPSQETLSYFVSLIYSGENPHTIAYMMRKMGVVGQFSVSCGSSNTSLNFLDLNSLTLNFSGEDQYGSLQFSCPKCGTVNTRPMGQFISNCRHCGGDVRC